MATKVYQPHTTDTTARGLMVARNAMRKRLWQDDDGFAHRWLCHPGEECKDSCQLPAIPARAALYDSELEE